MNSNIKQELKNVKYATVVIYLVVLASVFIDNSRNNNFAFFTFVKIAFLSAVFYGYIKSTVRLNYGFWGFSVIIFFILVFNMLDFIFFNKSVAFLGLNVFALGLFALNSYAMSSPLYYSRVQWWEYDYKYRADLKIQISIDGQDFDGRLTDLRRSEGSMEMFEELLPGREGKIQFRQIGPVDFYVETRKLLIPGRPIRYGVKFDAKDPSFRLLKDFWSENKNVKLRNKFKQ